MSMQKIMLVEDDDTIAFGIRSALGRKGYEVIWCRDIAEAKRIYSGEMQLILLDLNLPDGSGYELCGWVKQERDTPVIFLTVRDDVEDITRGLDMGADDYITKPFRPRELVARIKTALRKSGGTPSYFEINGLYVDMASGIVRKNGSEVFLSALEYRLLLVFISNPKSIITRDRLLNELWDAAGEFVTNNTLTVYIKRLREKIEDDPAEPEIILTVRGTGYRLGGG